MVLSLLLLTQSPASRLLLPAPFLVYPGPGLVPPSSCPWLSCSWSHLPWSWSVNSSISCSWPGPPPPSQVYPNPGPVLPAPGQVYPATDFTPVPWLLARVSCSSPRPPAAGHVPHCSWPSLSCFWVPPPLLA
jgi:hypothetical protein